MRLVHRFPVAIADSSPDPPAKAAYVLGCAAAVRSAQRTRLGAARRRQDLELRQALERRLGAAVYAAACADGAAADALPLARGLVAP